MHRKHGAFYYVHRNKWTRLSDDYGDALRIYAGLISPNQGGMPALLDRFIGQAKLAHKTLKTYRICVERLKTAFEAFEPNQVLPRHLYEYFTAKEVSDGMAAHFRSVMVGAMQLAVREGLVDRNLMREVEQFKSGKRERYLSNTEFATIREKATPTLRSIMDVCYMTGQRIGDVLAIKLADLTKDGIVFVQQKTGTKLCVGWSAELEEAVREAKSLHTCVRGLTLFHTRKGTPFAYWTIRTLWDRACKESGVENAHIHDIRAKAATDAKREGIDSKALLGHKSDAVHLRYLRDKTVPVVTGLRRVS